MNQINARKRKFCNMGMVEYDKCEECDQYDTVNMVQCDDCDKWAHFSCVGVGPEIKYVGWSCRHCINVNIAEYKTFSGKTIS